MSIVGTDRLITRNSPNVYPVSEPEDKGCCHKSRIRNNRRALALADYDSFRIRRTIDRHLWAFARFYYNHTPGRPAWTPKLRYSLISTLQKNLIFNVAYR